MPEHIKGQKFVLAEETEKKQASSNFYLQKATTVEVPVLIEDDLPSLPYLKDVFAFMENILFVSSPNDNSRSDILKIYKQTEKFLLARLYEYERNVPFTPEQEKRIHLYKERKKSA